jgi:hypothetical protein
MRSALLVVSMIGSLVGSLLAPPRAAAQEIVPGLVGGAAGLAAGGFVAIGIVTLQARRGNFLYSTADALGWHATPILVGAGTGAAIGFFDQERLRRTIIGGAIGGAVGTGVGALLGLTRWPPPEGKWAGGVIGGAAGLLVGSIVGVLWPAPRNDPQGAVAEAGVPIGVTIPF